jgi:GH15 family glucan-1,4-alpha-glucosidase
MPQANPLKKLIVDDQTPKNIAKIKAILAAQGTHEIRPVAHGLFAASGSQAADSVTGYQNVWIRDNIMVANSFRLRGFLEPAIACIQGLTRFFEKLIPRFQLIISDPDRTIKEDVFRRPHIRFAAQDLSELTEKWPHAQNDALGQALWFRFTLANSGALPMAAAEEKVYTLFPNYFEAIEYWQDKDSGAWEEGRKINSSSVGAVVAGLEELRKYLSAGKGTKATRLFSELRLEKIEQLIAKGRARLAENLPFESPPDRMADSALLSLIHPLGLVVERSMQDTILNLVQARLKGEFGIKRYANDSYFCQDYDEWFAPGAMSCDFSDGLQFRDSFLQPNCEAQWCIFDPLLSVIYGERFLADTSIETSYQKQVHYFNRSLNQITPQGHCPELYFLKQGRYVANAHTPLAWTQANQALALHLMEKSVAKRSHPKKS